MHGVVRGQGVHHDGVTGLVIGGELALLFAHDAALLLGTGDDLDLRLGEVSHRDELAAAARGEQRGLVAEIFKVRAREAGRAPGNGGEVHVLGKGLILDVDAQDILAAADVGQAYVYLAVETAGTQQRGVKNIGAVCRRHDDDALVRAEAVHFDEQLVERLLTLVVAAAETCAALTAHGVDLVDEDDGRGDLLRLLEEVTHAACTDADIHFDKVGAGDGQKLHACLARDRAGQQRLARARRTDEQHALGDARAEVNEFRRLFQKVDDLLQFLFFLVRAGNVGKGRGALVVPAGLERGRAELGHAVAAATARGADGEEVPDGKDAENGENIGREHRDIVDGVIGGNVVTLDDAVRRLLLDELAQVIIEEREAEKVLPDLRLAVDGLAQRHAQRGIRHGEGPDLLLLKELAHLGIGRLGLRGTAHEAVHADNDEQHQQIRQQAGALGLLSQWGFLLIAAGRRKEPRPRAGSIFGIYFRLQYADVGHIAVLLRVVETVADDELIGHLEACKVGDDGLCAAGRLVEQRHDGHAGSALGHEVILEEVERIAGVENVLDDNNVAARNVLLEVVRDLHHAGRGRRVLIGRDGDEFNVALELAGAHNVGHEDERALQHAEEQGVLVLQALIERIAHLLHARSELLLGIQYLQDILIHIALSHSFFLHFLFIRICCI